ncbi:TetR/AcrR family transcriptional regulator [Amycolatopsis cihanbeyliensis]|uniref:TetR family transcriptional regulator n=1 Tax=Amycolatopsis cihanbeyliensis TaxID=1128664 RepID=A0A542DKH7_AMYCI|nr:TetR/AcrR family transcriptional regulator [Amycolatopsis cihanbeyliensis]TQJ03600.1 TetR family transcriptional regulator [Amycolatopsis cihanbeyliensis]
MSTPSRRGPGRPRKLSVARQRRLVLTAARQVFAEQGMQAATVGQIAGRAGLSRQSVYEQFGDKAGLFAEVVAEVEHLAFEWISARATDETAPDLRAWARRNYAALFDFAHEHPDALPVLQEAERAGDPAMTRIRARLVPLYTEASRQRWAAHGVEPGRADTALVAMYFAMTETVLRLDWQGAPPDRSALIDLLTEFTVGGVLRLYEHGDGVLGKLR